MKKLLDINTTRHERYRPTIPNQEMNGEQSPVCLFVYGIKRMKLEWKKSLQLNILSNLDWESNPDLCDWSDAMLYPLSYSSQLESRPLWVCSYNWWWIWNDSYFWTVDKEITVIMILAVEKTTLSGWKRTWKNSGLTYLWLNLSTHLSLDQIVTTWDSLFPSPIDSWLLMIKARK